MGEPDGATTFFSIGEELVRLLSDCETVVIFHDKTDHSCTVSAVITKTQERRNTTNVNLLSALQAATGNQPARRCITCKEVKVLTRFAKIQGRYIHYCLDCESKRVIRYKRAKKGSANSPADD